MWHFIVLSKVILESHINIQLKRIEYIFATMVQLLVLHGVQCVGC